MPGLLLFSRASELITIRLYDFRMVLHQLESFSEEMKLSAIRDKASPFPKIVVASASRALYISAIMSIRSSDFLPEFKKLSRSLGNERRTLSYSFQLNNPKALFTSSSSSVALCDPFPPVFPAL